MIKFRYKRKEPIETPTSAIVKSSTATNQKVKASSISTLPKSARISDTKKTCTSSGSLTRAGTLQRSDNGGGILQKNESSGQLTKVNCGVGLQKVGSNSSLAKAAGLQKTGSNASLQKIGSSSSLQRSRAGTPVQKLDPGKVLQKTATRVPLQKTLGLQSNMPGKGGKFNDTLPKSDHRKSEEMLHNGDYGFAGDDGVGGVKKNNTLPRTKNEKTSAHTHVASSVSNSIEMASLARNFEVSIVICVLCIRMHVLYELLY